MGNVVSFCLREMFKTKRRLFIRNILKGLVLGVSAWLALNCFAQSPASTAQAEKPEIEKKSLDILKEICKEVIEFRKAGKEGFINQEFHLDLDGDPANSEEHVNVLIYDSGGRKKMVLQVTYFETMNRIVKHAKEIRQIVCFLKGDQMEIERCDYNGKQIKSILSEILKEIRYEKELLKQIDRQNWSFIDFQAEVRR
jgi:hypothetical protein